MRGRRRRSARVNEVRGRTSRRRLHSRLSRAMNDSDGTVRAEGSEFINTKWHLLLSLLFYFGFFLFEPSAVLVIRTGIAGRPTSDGRAPPPPLQDGLLTIVRPTREGPVATVPATKLTRHTHIQTHTQTHTYTHTHTSTGKRGRQTADFKSSGSELRGEPSPYAFVGRV